MGHSKKALNEILFFLEPPRQKRLKQKDAQRKGSGECSDVKLNL